MTKYQAYYQKMWETHKTLLSEFLDTHDKFKSDRKKYSKEYNDKGKAVREIMEEWDARLCQQMERGQNAVFSSKVSEKFWNEVKKDFPLIEFVGVEFL